jgi:arylsulfatase A
MPPYDFQPSRRGFLSAAFGAALAKDRRPPNFLVVLADDLGAKELGCYGNTKYKTPNLDRLAQTGVWFRTAYATPVCHPTRVMILTGQYGCHNGVYNFAGKRGGPDPGSPAEDMGKTHITFAQVLKQRGYATALAGKWQLSGRYPTLIRECGFDEYCVWAYQNYLSLEDQPKFKGRRRYWDPSVMQNGKLIETTINDYGPDIYSGFLSDFIRRKRNQPFLAYYPATLTHGPFEPPPGTAKSDADKLQPSRAHFGACLEYLDRIMGRLVKTLEEAGVRDNTIILFTADNGTAGDGKAEATELGARVPFIANCPGIVKPRGASDELVDLSDAMPTLAEFAGAPLPADRPIDGRSIAGHLRGDKPAPREWIFSFIADRRIIRTKRWLLEDNSPLHYGRLYDCGNNRDGEGYQDVTKSNAPEVLAVKA